MYIKKGRWNRRIPRYYEKELKVIKEGEEITYLKMKRIKLIITIYVIK